MNEIRCGFADGIITPALNGTFLDGYGFRMTPAETVRDDLHAKVMAVGDGDDTHASAPSVFSSRVAST